jgi:hypothetical protein
MTDKITLELTLDELKTLDKHIEYNEETKSVFDKIKDAYPQPKMTLANSGYTESVYYNNEYYYRIHFGSLCLPLWLKVNGNDMNTIMDAETERLLEGLYYNHIEVKKEKEQGDNEWKTVALRFGEELVSVGPCGYYEFTPEEWYDWVVNTYEKLCDDTVKLLKKENLKKAQKREEPNTFTPKEIKELIKEGLEWCEDHPNENPLDWVKPQTPEQVEQGLKEAFREAVKQGVVSSTKSPTLYDVCMKWWNVAYREDCINDLVNRIEAWLPEEQSAAGSQNAYVECTVEGFNDCLNGIKRKLR